jgi:hypothetical protein
MVYDGKDITMYRNASSVAHLAVQGMQISSPVISNKAIIPYR